MKVLVFILSIFICFPNIGNSITMGCCSGTSLEITNSCCETDAKEACSSQKQDKDSSNNCGSNCTCAPCLSIAIIFQDISSPNTQPRAILYDVPTFVKTYFFEFPNLIWHPPKLA